MRKSLLFILISCSFFAQTHRFFYEFKFKSDTLSETYDKATTVLDINPEDVKYFDYEFVITDSINLKEGNHSRIWTEIDHITRKKNSFENTTYTLINAIYAFKTKDEMIWKLSNETQDYKNYKLQKATTTFGGRNWIAWFCKEIPINEGPYKFRGLPGIIFKLEDTKKYFSFELIKSEKIPKTYVTNQFIETYYGEKPLFVKEKIIFEKKLEGYVDPLHDFKESYKKAKENNQEGSWKVMGTEIKDISQFKELTEKTQNYIRKNNNPIELNKAIHYPKN